MTRIPFPSTPPRGAQQEVCMLCERTVNAEEGYIAEVEGLYGRFVCIYHGSLGTEPSWLDLRGADTALLEAAAEAQREPPFGDTPWWDANGANYIELEGKSDYVYLEDGTTALRKEA